MGYRRERTVHAGGVEQAETARCSHPASVGGRGAEWQTGSSVDRMVWEWNSVVISWVSASVARFASHRIYKQFSAVSAVSRFQFATDETARGFKSRIKVAAAVAVASIKMRPSCQLQQLQRFHRKLETLRRFHWFHWPFATVSKVSPTI